MTSNVPGCPLAASARTDVRPFLDVCPGHLSPATWAWLDAKTADHAQRDLDRMHDPARREYLGLTGGRTCYGWLVYVPEPVARPVPEDLAAVQRLARSLGCDLVVFDCDAPLTPGLPILHPAFRDRAAAARP